MEFFLRCLQLLVKLLYIIVYAVLNLVKIKRRPSIPPIQYMLLTLPISELTKLLRTRQITSRELVLVYIHRIQEVNPHTNAVIDERFADALQDAVKADRMIRKCSAEEAKILFARYPILGIPFSVKESCGVKGMSQVVGSLKRVGKKAKMDCEAVANLRAAGGIPLLVTITPEYCFSIETDTFTRGRCVNPYDALRTCGGSSGGEGALNAAAGSIFGVGSDLDGSIRIPALFNGIFGHKPTGGLISNRGHFPNSSDPNCAQYLQMGPMTRFGRDLPLLLHIMVGKNAKKLDLLTPLNDKHIKIFYSFGFDGLNGFLHHSVDYDIKIAIWRAANYFKRKGLPVKQTTIRNFRNSTEIAMTGIARLKKFPFVMTNNYRPPRIFRNVEEYIRSFCGFSKITKEALLYELMRSTNGFMPAENMQKYVPQTKYLKEEILHLLDTNGVLFFPTFHVPAIHHNSAVLPLWNIDYCLIFNILGLPSTHIPMGLNRNGIPIGFQVVAAPMCDKLCLHIAAELEQAFGGWIPAADMCRHRMFE